MAGVDDSGSELIDRLRKLLEASASGDQALPGEPSLASALGASRPALREALMRLESEGLVSRRRGAGTTINREAHRIPARFDQQVEFVQVIAASGRTAGLEVIEAGVSAMSQETAAMLGRATGEPSYRTVKRWTADDDPVMVAVDEFALGHSDGSDIDDALSLFTNVAVVLGHDVEWEVARPTAILPDEQVAGWVGASDPLLVLDLLGVSRHGDLLYRALEYHVPGAVQFGFVRTVSP